MPVRVNPYDFDVDPKAIRLQAKELLDQVVTNALILLILADKYDTIIAWGNSEFVHGNTSKDLQDNARHLGRLQRNDEILAMLEAICTGDDEWALQR